MKKVATLLIITIFAITGICLTYDKSHKVRICKVIQKNDQYITVLHPNGEFYDFFTWDSEKYQKDTYIRVSFNEFRWDKEYEVNTGNPKPVLLPIESIN